MTETFSEIEITYKPKQFKDGGKINTTYEMQSLLRKIIDSSQLTVREECYALFFNRANTLIGSYKVSSGGISGTVVDLRLILAIALKTLCTSIVLAHSHPSGNLSPSRQDIAITEKLRQAAQLMDIQLLDHIILTETGYYSFTDERLL